MIHRIFERLQKQTLSVSRQRKLYNKYVCRYREYNFTEHSSKEHDCDYTLETVGEQLPDTDLDIAREISEVLGQEMIYSDGWKIWDDGEYVPCGEEWPRRAVAWYADAVAQIDINQLIELSLPLKGNIDENEREEQRDEKFDKYAKPYYRSLNQLKSDRGNKAIMSMMQVTSYPPRKDVSGRGVALADFLTESMTPGLVEGLLPGAGLGQMYGESYIGKTFAAVDLACSVASGRSGWLGHKIVKPGSNVLYVAAEGGDPIRKMFHGWIAGHPGLTPSGITLRDAASGHRFSLTDPTMYGLDDLKADYEALGSPALVVIDPQADVTGGVDENSKALADALRPLGKWANEAGCFVLLVHHTGKDASKGARGSSAQKAMMDVQIEFSKGGSKDIRELKFTKVKGEKLPDSAYEYEFRQANDYPYLEFKGARKSPQEEAEALAYTQRIQVKSAISNGAQSARAITEATGLSREVVTQFVKELLENKIITNAGSPTHPRYVVAATDSVD